MERGEYGFAYLIKISNKTGIPKNRNPIVTTPSCLTNFGENPTLNTLANEHYTYKQMICKHNESIMAGVGEWREFGHPRRHRLRLFALVVLLDSREETQLRFGSKRKKPRVRRGSHIMFRPSSTVRPPPRQRTTFRSRSRPSRSDSRT